MVINDPLSSLGETGVNSVARKPTLEELAHRIRTLETENLAAKNELQELRREADRFREFAEMLPEIVFEMDQEGVLTFVNQRAYEISGY